MQVSSRLQKKALAKVQEAAKETERLLAARSLEESSSELRILYDRLLAQDEYFVLVSRDGLSLLHTNRLREGNRFNDLVGLKAAETLQPLTQIYPRNTGEILIDASAPIHVNGKPAYSLRLGVVVPSLSFRWRMLATSFLPALVATGGMWMGDSVFTRTSFSIAAVGFALLMGQLTFRTFLLNWKNWISVTKSISSGKLQARVETTRRDELGQMSFEINKMVIGMHSILTELAKASGSTHEISTKQRDMVRDLLAASQQLSAGLQQISSGATEQTKLIEETEKVTKEITHKIRQTGPVLEEASTLSQEAESSALSGMEKTKTLHSQMLRIQQAGFTVESGMQQLEQQAAGIRHMIRDIREIAEQTNLLALNAAIEAARAGEEGKGFAVVADEVRKLASRSDEVASQVMHLAGTIGQKSNEAAILVKEERQEVDEGLKLVDELHALIQVLTDKSSSAASQTARTSKVMTEILQAVDSIEKQIESVREISHSFTSAAQEVTASGEMQHSATEHLDDQTRQLREVSDKIHQIANRFQLE
ncbi:methyl-accepting chemotaxis protein [Effusibacillus consociatus]